MKNKVIELSTDLLQQERKLTYEKGSEMLIKDVLEPLLHIVSMYKYSDYYNKPIHDNMDPWDYYQRSFLNIYNALNKNLYIKQDTYLKVLRIIQEIHTFVCSFSGADGLAERYFELCPFLNYYRVPYGLHAESVSAYKLAAEKGLLPFVPSKQAFRRMRKYFLNKQKQNDLYNFGYDEDDFFIQDLTYAIRLMFLHDLSEFE